MPTRYVLSYHKWFAETNGLRRMDKYYANKTRAWLMIDKDNITEGIRSQSNCKESESSFSLLYFMDMSIVGWRLLLCFYSLFEVIETCEVHGNACERRNHQERTDEAIKYYVLSDYQWAKYFSLQSSLVKPKSSIFITTTLLQSSVLIIITCFNNHTI